MLETSIRIRLYVSHQLLTSAYISRAGGRLEGSLRQHDHEHDVVLLLVICDANHYVIVGCV